MATGFALTVLALLSAVYSFFLSLLVGSAPAG
jgi:hypothetical protein